MLNVSSAVLHVLLLVRDSLRDRWKRNEELF